MKPRPTLASELRKMTEENQNIVLNLAAEQAIPHYQKETSMEPLHVPHKPDPMNRYQVLECQYAGHYNFSGEFQNLEEFRKWAYQLRSFGDDWERGGMERRTIVEKDSATGKEVARGPIESFYESLKVWGIIPSRYGIFGPQKE